MHRQSGWCGRSWPRAHQVDRNHELQALCERLLALLTVIQAIYCDPQVVLDGKKWTLGRGTWLAEPCPQAFRPFLNDAFRNEWHTCLSLPYHYTFIISLFALTSHDTFLLCPILVSLSPPSCIIHTLPYPILAYLRSFFSTING